MIKQVIEDLKLKDLINICKKTKNYKKIAVTIFILIGNKTDEIGIYLGLRPRNKSDGEKIFEYMNIINLVFEKSFKFKIIKNEIITIIKEIEILFIKNQGKIQIDFIKAAIDIYYELRKIEVPNVYEEYNIDLIEKSPEFRIYSYLNPIPRRKGNNKEEKVKLLIKNNIENQEVILQNELEHKFKKKKFERILYFEKLKKSIEEEKEGKIIIRGLLKDNIDYQLFKSQIPGYYLLSIFLLFMMLGLAIAIQSVLRPSTALSFSPLFLGFFGAACFMFLIYWNNYHKEEK